VFSNGVAYLALNFDLAGLPAELWPILPHYIDAVNKMGAVSPATRMASSSAARART
jgi:hypothetical protein